MDNYTKTTVVKGKAQIWAKPSYEYDYELEENVPTGFEYVIQDYAPWQNGSVMVSEQEIELTVPAGINLVEQAIETLERAEEEALHQYNETKAELSKRKQQLLQITYQETV